MKKKCGRGERPVRWVGSAGGCPTRKAGVPGDKAVDGGDRDQAVGVVRVTHARDRDGLLVQGQHAPGLEDLELNDLHHRAVQRAQCVLPSSTSAQERPQAHHVRGNHELKSWGAGRALSALLCDSATS